MKRFIFDLLGLVAIASLCIGCYNLGMQVSVSNIKETEQHPLCYDNKKQEAWIAKKGNRHRCFMEGRDYPHRVRASNLDNIDETN